MYLTLIENMIFQLLVYYFLDSGSKKYVESLIQYPKEIYFMINWPSMDNIEHT